MRAITSTALHRARGQARAKIIAAIVTLLEESLNFPVLLHPVVLLAGDRICKNTSVLLHEVVVSRQHAVALHERDARCTILVSAESTAPLVPSCFDVGKRFALKPWVSLSVAFGLGVRHTSFLAETAFHDTALILTVRHPMHFSRSQVSAADFLHNVRVPLKIAGGLVVSR